MSKVNIYYLEAEGSEGEVHILDPNKPFDQFPDSWTRL